MTFLHEIAPWVVVAASCLMALGIHYEMKAQEYREDAEAARRFDAEFRRKRRYTA